jgi:DNA polymerase III subunit epsilon
MREIVLDTETTGFDPETGRPDRGDRRRRAVEPHADGAHLPPVHQPARAMPQEAFEVHGLGDDFLRDKPLFRDIAGAFVDFVGDAKLVIHNAAFDMKFINAEFGWLKLPRSPSSGPSTR